MYWNKKSVKLKSSQCLDIGKWLIIIYVREWVSQSLVTLSSVILVHILQLYFPSKSRQYMGPIVRDVASEQVYFLYLSKILLYLSNIFDEIVYTRKKLC